MVKVERTPTPPPSLAIEREKAHGSYTGADVIEQLHKDFHGKCYLCELKDLTDIQVEHLRPHHNRQIKERVFDWNNLFYACPHCNSIKNNRRYDDKILDCCEDDPEYYLDHIYRENQVVVRTHSPDCAIEEVEWTADLLQNCFEQRNTGIRTMQCTQRVKRLAAVMNNLYKTLDGFQKNPTSVRYIRALRAMLSREYEFAAFTRYYVRDHLDIYPELAEFVSIVAED